ncbi:MAG: hypothetical protein ABL908_11115 [Hyphomicrobium sp.]
MTIVYDPERKRAEHVESKLAIQFLRWGPYIQEGDVYFALTWQGKTREFEAALVNQRRFAESIFPNLSSEDIDVKAEELNTFAMKAWDLGIDIAETVKKQSSFPEVFLKTWHRVIRGMTSGDEKIFVYLMPNFDPADGRWSYGDE